MPGPPKQDSKEMAVSGSSSKHVPNFTMVDTSFYSIASTSSSGSNGYEVESEVGRDALKEICCSVLSRLLDFPDGHLETFLGFDEETDYKGDGGGMNIAKWGLNPYTDLL